MAEKDQNPLIKYRKEIVIGLIALFAFLFLVFNYQKVEFWFFGKMHVPLIILLLIFSLIGALITGIYFWVGRRDNRKEIKALKAENEVLKSATLKPVDEAPQIEE